MSERLTELIAGLAAACARDAPPSAVTDMAGAGAHSDVSGARDSVPTSQRVPSLGSRLEQQLSPVKALARHLLSEQATDDGSAAEQRIAGCKLAAALAVALCIVS